MLPDYLSKVIAKIAKNEGFSEYSVDTNLGSGHGENFLGVMTSATIVGTKGKKGSTTKSKLHLLCKTPPFNEIRRKTFQSNIVFDREIFVYSTLLPAFMRFQQEKGLSEADSFVSFPKVYECVSNIENGTYTLIMDDLRPKNFEMYRERVIGIDHELFVMRELGKFHAISFAMKDQRPNEFEQFKQMNDTFGTCLIHGKVGAFMRRSVERAAEALKNPEHKKLMEDFRKTFVDIYDDYLNGESSKEFAIITHGDVWNNNLLFKYTDSDKSKVESICFVDWQMTRYCPPVLDLLYNIFTATDKPFRDQHYEKLLKTYYSSLSDSIRKLGSDPDKLYTYENFKNQLRKFGKFALLCAPMIISLAIAGPNDIGSLEEWTEQLDKGEEPDLLRPYDEDIQQKYSTLINDLVTDLINYGYIGNQ